MPKRMESWEQRRIEPKYRDLSLWERSKLPSLQGQGSQTLKAWEPRHRLLSRAEESRCLACPQASMQGIRKPDDFLQAYKF